jgi:monovalent cation:H+ antiporter-2, CPA2 family
MAVETLSNYKDILIVLGTAGIVMPFLMRIGINTVLGFLLIGVLLGPHVLGQLVQRFPDLQLLSLSAHGNAPGMAELGIVLLLFLIGLELSLERLKALRKLVFGLGTLQVVISGILIAIAAKALGFSTTESTLFGMALSLSSTAIVIQYLSQSKRTSTQAGRVSFAVLLMQDLAVIPMLLMIAAWATTGSGNTLAIITTGLGQAIIAITLIVLVGRFLLPPLLRFVAGARSPDLFMAVVLFAALGTGAAATFAGLSMSLGAFLAGLLIAETEFRRAVEAIIEPFKGLLLGVFFLLVGFDLDLPRLLANALPIVAVTLGFVALKATVVFGLARLFRVPQGAALEASALLGPGGEFAVILLTAAITAGLLSRDETRDAILVVTLSMMLIPLLGYLAKRSRAVAQAPAVAPELSNLPASHEAKVIIAGFGRVGQSVADLLRDQNISYVAADLYPEGILAARKQGYSVYYGDAANLDFLRACGLATAKTLALTMDSPKRADEVIRIARAERPDIKIIARARDDHHAKHLYEVGASEAVPETFEASLQLAESILVETGVPMGLAIASVHERRDQHRKLLGRPNRRAEIVSNRKRIRTHLEK